MQSSTAGRAIRDSLGRRIVSRQVLGKKQGEANLLGLWVRQRQHRSRQSLLNRLAHVGTMTEKGGCLRRTIRRFRLQMRARVLEADIMAARLLALFLD